MEKFTRAQKRRTNELWMLASMQLHMILLFCSLFFSFKSGSLFRPFFFSLLHCWRLLSYSFVWFKNLPATFNSSSIICLLKLSSLSPFHRIMSTWKSRKKNLYLWMTKQTFSLQCVTRCYNSQKFFGFSVVVVVLVCLFCSAELANVRFHAGKKCLPTITKWLRQ